MAFLGPIFGGIASDVLGGVVRNVLFRDDVPVQNKHVTETTRKVVEAIEEDPDIAVVPVTTGWFSKINWTAAAGPIASVLIWFGLDISAENLVAIILGVQALQSVATVIFRTFFTTSVTKASAGK